MILTCPACRTRYLVDDAAVADPHGRTVRCAGCGHRWHHFREDEEAPTGPSVALGAPEPIGDIPRLEPAIDAPPRPGGAMAAPDRARRRVGWVGVGWAVLVVVLVAVVLTGIFARGEVVAMWPPVGRLYSLAGFPVEPLGAGLEIERIVPTRTPTGLIIAGEISNVSKTVRTVPRLRIVLRNAARKEVQFKIIDPPKTRLLPGETAHFETPFTQPSDAATGVAVTFAPG